MIIVAVGQVDFIEEVNYAKNRKQKQDNNFRPLFFHR